MCYKYISNPQELDRLQKRYFVDVWKVLHPNETGYTFSNMPWPGMQSRPDRILIEATNENIQLRNVVVSEDGVYYGKRYYWNVIWERTKEYIQTVITPLRVIFFLCSAFIVKIYPKYATIPFLIFYGYFYYIDVFNYIAEEFFPSDHQILVTTLELVSK